MKQILTIPGKLPSLNEYISACRTSAHKGGKFKRSTQDRIGWEIKAQRLHPITRKVDVSITWAEPNMRRDPDNIQAGVKFILDALVECGILRDDGWDDIGEITHRCVLNRENPRVVVELEER